MTKTSKWILTGVASLAAVGLLFTVPAFAQADTANGAPQAAVAGQGRGMGRMGANRGGMRNGNGPMFLQRDVVRAAMAEKLSLSVDELNQAITDGKTLADLAAEKGIDPATLKAAMTEAAKGNLDSLVQAGTITQEQADLMLERHTQNAGACLTGQAPRMGQGRGQGMGQGQGWQTNGTTNGK